MTANKARGLADDLRDLADDIEIAPQHSFCAGRSVTRPEPVRRKDGRCYVCPKQVAVAAGYAPKRFVDAEPFCSKRCACRYYGQPDPDEHTGYEQNAEAHRWLRHFNAPREAAGEAMVAALERDREARRRLGLAA